MSVLIYDIAENSYAQKMGIEKGETLYKMNGKEVCDVLDFRFLEQSEKVKLLIFDKKGKKKRVKIKKEEFEEIGLIFETYLMDKQHSCKNKCVFCFVDQNPKGMRDTIYFKDDDTRLSFLFGNYVTLTNITEREIERIIKLHISPINISVHTTDPELRVQMMKNPHAAEAMDIMRRFKKAGIAMNCQIVLCPEINDGMALHKSLEDLFTLAPALQSIALVPVGLTEHREGLCPLKPYTKESARAVIEMADGFGKWFKEKCGSRLVYCSDEFYLKAQLPLPETEYYEDFCQLDNGVGLMRNMEEEISIILEETEKSDKKASLSFVTGVDAAPFIKEQLGRIKGVYENFEFEVYPIENCFFGKSITVAGLVTAGDIIKTLKDKELFEALVLPDVMLRSEKDKFLDDLSVEDLENALNIPVKITTADGNGLFCTVSEFIKNKEE